MKQDKIKKYMNGVKKPVVQLGFVLLAGLVINAILFMWKVQPDFVENVSLGHTLQQLEKQQAIIMNTPLPVKVDEAEVEQLILQVPTKFEISRVLLEFKDIEETTGVRITELTVGGEKEEVKDELADYIQNALKQAPVQTQDLQQTESQQQAEGSETEAPKPVPLEPKLTTPIKPENVSLSINGTYEQVMEFMNQLYKMQRIVNIRSWDLTGDIANGFGMKFELTLYTAPKYVGSFHDLPQIEVRDHDNNIQPVITDEAFKQEILKIQPNLREVAP
jgi:Tfp pilus assembly protein PilO